MTVIVVDFVLFLLALWAAYAMRLGEFFVPNLTQAILALLLPVLGIPIFRELGVYYTGIRFLDARVLWGIFRGLALVFCLWTVAVILSGAFGLEGVPRSIPLLGLFTSGALIIGVRLLGRAVLMRPELRTTGSRPCLIVGQNEESRALLRVLWLSDEILPYGFLVEQRSAGRERLDDLPVFDLKDLDDLFERKPNLVVFTPASTADHFSQAALNRVVQINPTALKVLPGPSEIADQKFVIQQSRQISILDLLGREENFSGQELRFDLQEKTVLITGAAGTIGRELCRQVLRRGETKLIALDHSEFGLYKLQTENFWAENANRSQIALVSIHDEGQILKLLQENGVHEIYHAAAHKHVNILETNPFAAFSNNVEGTLALLRAAFEANVETFVQISTDKAVRPKSVMGASKRWSELLVHQFSERAEEENKRTRFSSVRFGNVLGSSGSVIPYFQRQIDCGGPVTVTDPDVIRYFMSTEEAARLVLTASSYARGGEIFVLEMGKPVKIDALARQMIRLSGHSVRDSNNPDGDIDIVYTGLKPGEKLSEELFIDLDKFTRTPSKKIFIANEPSMKPEMLEESLQEMRKAVARSDERALRALLLEMHYNTGAEIVALHPSQRVN